MNSLPGMAHRLSPNTLRACQGSELFCLYDDLLLELKNRDLIRSFNNPVADYAETVFCETFGWQRRPKSSKGFDAIGVDGKTRYEIKGRRITANNKGRQMGSLRGLDLQQFDVLAVVQFNANFTVHRACLVNYAVVKDRAGWSTWTSASRFILHENLVAIDGVEDVTVEVARASASLLSKVGASSAPAT